MKESKSYSAKIYEHGDFLIEIITINNQEREAWLSHKDYGIKYILFGTEVGVISSEEDFLELVVADLDSYIEGFWEVIDHECA